jgi:protein-S-isoprenylcysteine O-methyltransferase Ste14
MSEHLQEQDHAGVIAPPPFIYLGALLIGILLQLRFPLRFLPRSWTRFLFGGFLIGSSLLLGGAAFREMHNAGTNPNPHEPTTAIVSGGPYTFTRNPIYLSFVVLYTGIAIMANTLWVMLLLPVVQVVMRVGVIEREERYLERKFGEQYLNYKSLVRRWL